MKILRTMTLAVALAAFLVGSVACLGQAGSGSVSGGGAVGAAVDFELPTLEGAETVSPADFAGQVVLIDFWATWCVPCHAQQEVLEAVHAKVGEEVQFLAVDVGETETQVRGFVEKKPFGYPVLLDENSRVADGLGVYSLPTLMVVDTEGKVHSMEAGLVNQKRICSLLSEAGSTATC